VRFGLTLGARALRLANVLSELNAFEDLAHGRKTADRRQGRWGARADEEE
jgi:hypothetical protein